MGLVTDSSTLCENKIDFDFIRQLDREDFIGLLVTIENIIEKVSISVSYGIVNLYKSYLLLFQPIR